MLLELELLLLLGGKSLLLLRGKLLLLLRGKSLLLLGLSEELVELLLGKLRGGLLGGSRTYGGGLTELGLTGSKLLLLGSKSLLLRSKSLLLGGKGASGGEFGLCEMGKMGGESVDLTILVLVTRETVEADVLLGELRNGDEGGGCGGRGTGGGLGSGLLKLLTLLWSKLLRLLGSKPLRLLSKLLWLLSKLLWLLLRCKLLSALLNKLLRVEVLEVC